MSFITRVIMLSFAAILIENIVFTYAIGTSTMFLDARSKKQFVSFGLCITYFSVVSSMLAYFANKYLRDYDSVYLITPIIYVLIVGAVYTLTLLVLWKLANKAFMALKKYIHVSAFNCAVLGSVFINVERGGTLIDFAAYGLGTGIGFLLATYLMSIVYEKLYSEDIPESLRGMPATLLYIGILSMAFYGLVGHQTIL